MKKISSIFIGLTLFFIFTSEIHAQVLINEFSSHDSSDWVELYAFEDTDISGWILRDTATTKMGVVPDNVLIGPTKSSSFYVVEVGNRLNVDGDTIKLLKPDDATLVNQVIYGGSGNVCAPESSESVGRVDNGNTIERFATPTKGLTNVGAQLNPCPTPTPDPTQTPSPTKTPTPTPTPTKTPTPAPTKTATPKPTQTPNEPASPTDSPTDVLGATDASSEPSPTPLSNETQDTQKPPILAIIFIALGVISIAFAGFSIWKKSKTPQVQNTI